MRRFGFLSILVALVIVSCEKRGGEIDDNGGQTTTNTVTEVIATIGDASRVSALVGADGQMQLYWSSSDKLLVTDLSNKATFALRSGAGSAKGQFNGSIEVADKPLYALYPAGSAAVDGGAFKVTIPTTQSYVATRGIDAKDRIQLFGISENHSDFTLFPLSAFLKFDITLPTERVIRAVTMTAEQAGIAGVGSVVADSASFIDGQSNSLTLNYDSPKRGHSDDGWAAIAPVDLRAASGKVLYDVLTDEGVYTFCYTPEQSFTAGDIYTVTLSVEDFEQVADKASLKSGQYYYSNGMVTPQPDPDPEPDVDPQLNVRVVRATDSTIAIGWTITAANVPYLTQAEPNKSADYSVDITKEYKVAIYRDAACTDLVYSVSKVKNNTSNDKALFNSVMIPPRFIFAGLEPATTYYVKVFNVTDSTSNATPLQVTTKAPLAAKSAIVSSNAGIGDLIVFENFAGLVYAGDLTMRAAGVSRTDRANLTSFEGVALKGEIEPSATGYYTVDAGTEIGLFNTLAGILDEMKVDNWGWIGGKADANGGSVCARPGYVKIGTTSNRSYICTPILSAIPKGKIATLKVVFNASLYGSTSGEIANEAEKYMSIKALADASISSAREVNYSSVVDQVDITLEGKYVSDWKEYSVTLTGVPNGSSIALGGALDATTTNRMLLDDIRVYVEALEDAPTEPVAAGTITYSDGTPAAGVSVSDGFTVVQTAADGTYSFTPHGDAWYIYYTVPADCQVPINNYGQPAFFTRYSKTKITYNFTLTKLSGGKESSFSLFCLADPQCKDSTHRNRFVTESVPDVKAHAATKQNPCYGVTLGDVTYSEGGRNCEAQMPHLRDHMADSKIGMPIFQTMGNHDYTYFYTNNPISADETSSTYNLKAQRAFESIFGPIDYSWDRGDAHIVCMRNMQWTSNTSASKYTMEFTDEQYNWLKQDLAFVPKDKLVIFCVHIPITNSKNKNVQNVITLLKQFKEAHIMSGHTHYMRNEPTLSGGIYEHVHAAVCGTWWYSKVNGDGVPNGYGVYDIEGNTIKNWYYKGVNTGMNDRDYQIRLYRGNLKCGGKHEYIELQHGADVILANVFNADNEWVVKVYENGTYTGNMTMIPNKKLTPEAGTSQSSPTKPGTNSSQDWWAIGYHIGVVGRGHVGGTRANYLTNGFHMYKYTLKDKSATVRVEATDRFGRTYSTSLFTGDYDYGVMY